MSTRSISHWASLAIVAIVLAGSQTTFAQEGEDQQSLYDRLGGLAPISVVVNDFIDALIPDGERWPGLAGQVEP